MSTLGASNPRITETRRLARQAAERRTRRAFVVEGPTLVAEALHSAVPVLELFVSADAGPGIDALVHDAAALGVAVVRVTPAALAKMATTTTPQPVLAVVARPDDAAIGAPDAAGPVLVLDAVADPGNVGTLLRSAEAAGATRVIVGHGSADPFGPKAVRASAGAVFHVPIAADVDTAGAVAQLRAAGYRVLATRATDADDHTGVDLTGNVAIVVGNEAHGVGVAVGALVDGWITVRHAGRAESLNAAMAGTVVCFEALRQNRLDRQPGGRQGGAR